MTCTIDNETDLRAALADGGDVHVDGSTIIDLSAPLEITQPTKLVGGVFTVASGPAIVITSSNVELFRVQIAGTGSGYEAEQKLIHAEGTEASPLDNIAIRGCRLYGSRAGNIWLEWCRNVILSSNIIKRFLYSGITLISNHDVVATGNVVTDAEMLDPVVNVYGIAVTDADNTEAARSRNVSVTGNRVHLIDWEAIDTHGGDGVTITGNTVTASPRGIACVTGNSTRTTSPTRCVVVGNAVDGAGARKPLREGIWLGGMSGVPATGTVTGNHVTGYPDGKAFVTPYVDRSQTYVGGNTPPYQDWTPITMDGDYTANSVYTPEYMIDGNAVWVRGGGIPKSSTQRTVFGHIDNPHAWPSQLTFLGYVQGSNPDAGNGMWAVDENGEITLWYGTGTDTWSYHLSGCYQAR